VRPAVLRVEADGLVAVLNRLVVLLLGTPGEATDVEGGSVLGVEADGFVVLLDRLVVLLLSIPGVAAVDE
jgi:hypothetical protein